MLVLNPEREEHMNMELRAAREQSGKTQAQVAKEAKVSEVAYQLYEYDKREPGVRTAIRIARALDSTVEDLFGAATPTKEE
jgi:DNA-binding XRE family transcriptional regulator